MGALWNNLRGILNGKVLAEEVIRTIEVMYEGERQMNRAANEHQLLAYVLARRMKHHAMFSRGPTPSDEALMEEAAKETAMFSILGYPKSVRALGLYVIARERPDLIDRYPEFLGEYGQLTRPAKEAVDNGRFQDLYRSKNREA